MKNAVQEAHKAESRGVILATVAIFLALFAALEILLASGETQALKQFREYQSALTVVIVTIAIFMYGWTQATLTRIQIEQAEHLANRKDEDLIKAIESLTKEMKRRPAPNPAEIHLSLFGVKK